MIRRFRRSVRSAPPSFRRGSLLGADLSSHRKGSRTVGLADLKGRLPNGSRIGELRGFNFHAFHLNPPKLVAGPWTLES